MRRFSIIANSQKDMDYEIAGKICNMIKDAGGECNIISRKNYDEKIHTSPSDLSLISDKVECVLVLGGDGTIIQAAKDLLDFNIPLLGVNLGTMGFMAELEQSNTQTAINKLINDDYKIQSRFMIDGTITGSVENNVHRTALNDIVIGRTGFSRIMSVNVYVNDELVNEYRGDGVIVATPTGSTGYSLSAGGPIVKPDSRLMVITPVCSHSLSSKSIIVNEDDVITIDVAQSKKTQNDEAIATFDGLFGVTLKAGDKIKVKKSDKVTRIVDLGMKGFFQVIREKF